MRSRTGLIALVSFVLAAAVACGPGTADRAGSSAAPPPDHHRPRPRLPPPPRRRRGRCGPSSNSSWAACAARGAADAQRGRPSAGARAGAEASLQANTDALSQLVASAYGGAPADRFTPLWQRHLADLVAYAKGVAGNDTSATQTARLLLADADAYGSWQAEASKGRSKQTTPRPGCGCMSPSSWTRPTPTRPATTPGPTGSSGRPTSTCSPPAPPWPRPASPRRWPSAWMRRRRSCARPLPCCWASTWS